MAVNRVVITGVGAVSPYGIGADRLLAELFAGSSAVRNYPELATIGGMHSFVAARVPDIEQDARKIPRKHRRSMSGQSIYALLACREALAAAGLGEEICGSGRLGLAIGSTLGSVQTSEDFFRDFFKDQSLERMKSTTFFRLMNHSAASNVAQSLGVTGRVLAPAAACATGCLAVGLGYEQIAAGRTEMVLCGGSDEFHPLTIGTFDVMNAASREFNQQPEKTPRPFDRDRDGIVCGEGAGILLLESFDSARARGATVIAEIGGFATSSDPGSIANPDGSAMAACMGAALNDAGLDPSEIGYVNAHATATVQGDIAESEAIRELFGCDIAVSSLKGHMGHTMAASGSLELIATVGMLREKRLIPTLNLEHVDTACAPLNYLQDVAPAPEARAMMKNSFALGGVNSSIVIKEMEI
ncbi:MAG: beta-ketoacyl-[acyl-carrier-protein] synthase family protein [Desulfuromonas sp.]|nr:MAG: beta-ketoacyl-[acyl-carrier-protein] synthase family protein [Desulfuromonas sp.]